MSMNIRVGDVATCSVAIWPANKDTQQVMEPGAFSVQNYTQGAYLQCKYPGKFCRQPRACKRNGQLHRFCEEHRTKANNNQKRWSALRQQQRYEPYQMNDLGGSQASSSLNALPQYQLPHDSMHCELQAQEFDLFLDDLLAAATQVEPQTHSFPVGDKAATWP